MTNNRFARRKSRSLARPAVLLGAAVVVALWLWLGPGIGPSGRLGAAVGASTLAAVIVWFFRARAARRRNAALDVYAEREIARAQNKETWTRVKRYSTPGSVLRSRRALNLYP
jgi:hypothetical protein